MAGWENGRNLYDLTPAENTVSIKCVTLSAVIYSIIQSCRRRWIDLQEYLTDILTHMSGMKNNQIDSLLPECWQKTSAHSS